MELAVRQMIEITQSGTFDKSIKFLHFLYNKEFLKNLDSHARDGVNALSNATPVDTGETARSWYYEIFTSPNKIRIVWSNTNMADGVPVAILVQYGHATRTGYWVEGKDFINPAIRPIFDQIAEDIWNEVTRA